MTESELQYTFDCPPGIHPATFYEVRTVLKKGSAFTRLLFTADDLSTDTLLVLVGRNFYPSLQPQSHLRKFLDGWLGPGFVEAHSSDGCFDFTSLLDRKGVMTVKTVVNATHRKPFVHLKTMRPVKSKAVRVDPCHRPSPPSDSERFLEELANQIRSAPRYEPDRIYCPPLSPKPA